MDGRKDRYRELSTIAYSQPHLNPNFVYLKIIYNFAA